MAKRHLTPAEAFDLRHALQVATLDAMMASRRWEPGDLIFQGGTSLHLAHGSPRFSEDLDFLVRASLPLDAIAAAIQSRLGATAWLPPDMTLSVSAAKSEHNPHAFVVALRGNDVIGSVKVKVELWQTDARALAAMKVVVSPVRVATGQAAGMQAFVPTAELTEIYVDKVFAIAARPYLKPRDVFDLYFLSKGNAPNRCSPEAMRVRLATYPNETAEAWLDKAVARRDTLGASADTIKTDLARWLPSSWPLDAAAVTDMIASTLHAMDEGIAVMRKLAAEHRHDGTLRP